MHILTAIPSRNMILITQESEPYFLPITNRIEAMVNVFEDSNKLHGEFKNSSILEQFT